MQRTSRRVHPKGTTPLTVVSLASATVGPTLVVTANLHGDEVTGLAAVHVLDQVLPARLRRGRVVLLPSLNPGGLRVGSRVVPEDGVDLNRVFPGDARGGAAARVAAAVWGVIAEVAPAALLDLHADAAVAIPYAIVDRPVALRGRARLDMARRLDALAESAGVTAILEYRAPEYLRFKLDRSLAGAMVNTAHIPALTLEMGPRRAVVTDAVEAAVQSVLGVLAGLGMVDGPVTRHPTCRSGGPWCRAPAPRVQTSGVFVPAIRPGQSFAAGDRLGDVRGVDGTSMERVLAPSAGIVVSWADLPWVEPRAVVGTLGLEER